MNWRWQKLENEEIVILTPSDAWKGESEEIILLVNLKTKEVPPRSLDSLEGKFLTKHPNNQFKRENKHLQDGLKLNPNILKPLIAK